MIEKPTRHVVKLIQANNDQLLSQNELICEYKRVEAGRVNIHTWLSDTEECVSLVHPLQGHVF